MGKEHAGDTTLPGIDAIAIAVMVEIVVIGEVTFIQYLLQDRHYTEYILWTSGSYLENTFISFFL